MQPLLLANDLYFERNGRELFRGLNFYLPPSNLLQVRGPNGVGKTTLLRLLAGLIAPSAGIITREAKWAYVGHVFGFTPWLTVKENLQFVAAMHRNKSDDLNELLAQFALFEYGHVFPDQLSAGQKRRLAFACLLLTRSKIWLVDEPFTALDASGVLLIKSMILQHLALQGVVVMTTHQDIDWQIPVQQLTLEEHACPLLV